METKYAYVIPFCKKDSNDLIFNISLWDKVGHVICKDNIAYPIDLVLYYSGQLDGKLVQQTAKYKHLFSNIVFKPYDIAKKDDYHPRAPGLMFFDLMLNDYKYDCIFYGEPDCLPVRDNWLKLLYDEFVDCERSDLWVKGSMYRGASATFIIPAPAFRFHFNGNGFYRVGDTDFKKFLTRLRPSINLNQGYDIEIMKVLMLPKFYNDFREFFAHARYTDFILNFGKQEYYQSYPRKTVFVHGKQVLIDMKKAGVD